MLTLEFKAQFTPDQKAIIDRYLEINRTVWNMGLAALEEWDDFHGYRVAKKDSDRLNNKGEPEAYYSLCCPLPWEYRLLSKEEVEVLPDEEKPLGRVVLVPFSRLLDERSRWYVKQLPTHRVPTPAEKKDSWGWRGEADHPGVTGYSCPIRRYLGITYIPLLERPGLQEKGGLGQVIKECNIPPEYGFITAVKYKFRSGELTHLDTAWQEYLKTRYGTASQRRGKPKYKGKRNKVATLVHPNPKGVITLRGGNILGGIPEIGSVRCKGLDKRWRNPDGTVPEIAIFKICKQPDGYYVQLTGKLERSFRVKETNKAVGIDPGITYELTLSDGKRIEPQRYFQRSQERLAKLQRRSQKQLHQNLVLWLHHPDRTIEDLKELISISEAGYAALRQAKTEAEMIEAIGASRFNILKYRQKSHKQEKLQQTIAKLNRKIALQRQHHDQQITTMIVRENGFIAVEDGWQSEQTRRKPKPKERADGRGYEANGREQQRSLNRLMSDASPGRKIALLEQKCDRVNAKGQTTRVFQRKEAAYTTSNCPVCGSNFHPVGVGNRNYRCLNCGWEQDQDVHAGINIELDCFYHCQGAELSAGAKEAIERNLRWEKSGRGGKLKPLWKRKGKR